MSKNCRVYELYQRQWVPCNPLLNIYSSLTLYLSLPSSPLLLSLSLSFDSLSLYLSIFLFLPLFILSSPFLYSSPSIFPSSPFFPILSNVYRIYDYTYSIHNKSNGFVTFWDLEWPLRSWVKNKKKRLYNVVNHEKFELNRIINIEDIKDKANFALSASQWLPKWIVEELLS